MTLVQVERLNIFGHPQEAHQETGVTIVKEHIPQTPQLPVWCTVIQLLPMTSQDCTQRTQCHKTVFVSEAEQQFSFVYRNVHWKLSDSILRSGVWTCKYYQDHQPILLSTQLSFSHMRESWPWTCLMEVTWVTATRQTQRRFLQHPSSLRWDHLFVIKP